MNQYTEKELYDVLGREQEIPEEINNRLQNTYKMITENKSVTHNSRGGRVRKKYMVFAAAAALAVGTITVGAAAYLSWNNGLSEEMRIDEEKQKKLEDSGMAVFSGVSCTDNGVTVTAQQSITDNYYTYLSFKVDGYQLPEGAEPSFESTAILVDGKDGFSWSGSFYDGLVPGPDGRVVYADGSPIDYEQPIQGKYVMEDGSLEYHIVLMNMEEKGAFVGKPIHVEIDNIGTAGKAEHIPDLDGKWVLDWTLGGADTAETFTMEEQLGDSGAVVREMEISPVSMKVLYDFPYKEITETSGNEPGKEPAEIVYTTFEEPPMPAGFKLKDGTLVNSVYGGPGCSGYTDESYNTYMYAMAYDRVINVDEIEAVLFVKSYPEAGSIPTEDNYYVVPLKRP